MEQRLHTSAGERLRDAVGREDVPAIRRVLNLDRAQLSENVVGDELRAAVGARSTRVIEVLLESGVPVDTRSDFGETALMLASGAGRNDVVALLLSRGADVHARSASGRTALFHAAAKDRLSVAVRLLSAGARKTERDVEGYTPLDVASQRPIAFTIPIWGAFVEGRIRRIAPTSLMKLLKG